MKNYIAAVPAIVAGLALALTSCSDGGESGSTSAAAKESSAPASQPAETEPADETDDAAAEEPDEDPTPDEVDCDDPLIRTDIWIENCSEEGADGATVEDIAGWPTVGETFTAGAFEVTIDEVRVGVTELVDTEFEMTSTPDNGQFVLAKLTVTNAASAPTEVGVGESTFIDVRGNTYSVSNVGYSWDEGEDLVSIEMQPGQTETGFIVWDVPADVTEIDQIHLYTVWDFEDAAPVIVEVESADHK